LGGKEPFQLFIDCGDERRERKEPCRFQEFTRKRGFFLKKINQSKNRPSAIRFGKEGGEKNPEAR